MDPVAKAINDYKEQYSKCASALSAYSNMTEEIIRKTVQDLETKHQEQLSLQQIEYENKLENLKEYYEKQLSSFKAQLTSYINSYTFTPPNNTLYPPLPSTPSLPPKPSSDDSATHSEDESDASSDSLADWFHKWTLQIKNIKYGCNWLYYNYLY